MKIYVDFIESLTVNLLYEAKFLSNYSVPSFSVLVKYICEFLDAGEVDAKKTMFIFHACICESIQFAIMTRYRIENKPAVEMLFVSSSFERSRIT